MAVIKLQDLTDGPQLVNYVVGEVNKASAFMQVSKQVPLSATGSVIPSVREGGDAAWTAEGAAKPVVQPILDTLTITGKKLTKIVYVTDEFADNRAYVWNKIKEDAIGSLVRTFDRTVAGLVAAPIGFTSLGDSPVTTVNSWSTFIAAIRPAGVNPNSAIVLNEALLFDLMALPSSNGDGPLLNITADRINGHRYTVADFRTTEPLGFVGPFATDAFWGVIPGTVRVEMSNEATIVDNGTTVNLWQENKRAILVEGHFGFRTSDDFDAAETELFRKVAAGAPVDPEV